MGLCGAGGLELDLAGLEVSQALASAADAVACRARELGVGDARWGPRARGERRRHTITNGVDCDLVSKGPGGSGGLSVLPGFGLGPQMWPPGPPLCPGGSTWFQVLGDSVAGTSAVLNLSPHPALNPLAGRPTARSASPLGGTFGRLPSTALAPARFPAMVGRPTSRGPTTRRKERGRFPWGGLRGGPEEGQAPPEEEPPGGGGGLCFPAQEGSREYGRVHTGRAGGSVPVRAGCELRMGAGAGGTRCHTVGMVRARVSQLKQMKELEQEQEVLLQGLEMMARGREWYQQQLQRVQERQRRLGQSRASAVSDVAQG